MTPKDTVEKEKLEWATQEAARLERLLTLRINRQYLKYTSVPDPAVVKAQQLAQGWTRIAQSPSPTLYMRNFVEALHRERVQGLPSSRAALPFKANPTAVTELRMPPVQAIRK